MYHIKRQVSQLSQMNVIAVASW